jgi:hypothetical protein
MMPESWRSGAVNEKGREMVAEADAVGRQFSTYRLGKGRPKLQPIDRRTRIGRRMKELVMLYSARLGDAALDPVVALSIQRAAELAALAEDLRWRALKGDPEATPNAIVRITRLADLSVRRLHLDRPQLQPSTPSLAAYLREAAE